MASWDFSSRNRLRSKTALSCCSRRFASVANTALTAPATSVATFNRSGRITRQDLEDGVNGCGVVDKAPANALVRIIRQAELKLFWEFSFCGDRGSHTCIAVFGQNRQNLHGHGFVMGDPPAHFGVVGDHFSPHLDRRSLVCCSPVVDWIRAQSQVNELFGSRDHSTLLSALSARHLQRATGHDRAHRSTIFVGYRTNVLE
jgi:hypothetical protein